MIKNILFGIIFFGVNSIYAQVGIGTTTPNLSSSLDITSTTSGLLIPRMTEAQRLAIVTPANGLLVYQTNLSSGFWYYNGSAWTSLSASSGWSLTGNTGTNSATNFIGTIDDKDIIFRRFNTRIGLINTNNISFGLNALNPLSTGNFNYAFGVDALKSNTIGGTNIAVGWKALELNQIGDSNTVVGNASMMKNISGFQNSAFGDVVLRENIDGIQNAAFGTNALLANINGNHNSAFGVGSLTGNNAGNFNTALGYFAMSNLTSGDNNLAIGNQVQVPNSTGSDQMNIANEIYGLDLTNIASGKIGIGTTTPSAKLHIAPSNTFAPNSTDGIIIPRVNNFPTPNPTAAQQSMLIYLTAQFGANIAGFYYWDNPTLSWKGIDNTISPYRTTAAATGVHAILMTDYTVRVFNGVSGIQLPSAAATRGKVFVIIGSNGISPKTVSTLGGNVYDDVTNTTINTLSANQRFIIQSDGTDWIVIGR